MLPYSFAVSTNAPTPKPPTPTPTPAATPMTPNTPSAAPDTVLIPPFAVVAQPTAISTSLQTPVAPLEGASYESEAVEYFYEVAFGGEYGSSELELHKWGRDIRIKVHGTPTADDLDTLSQVVGDLNYLVTGLTIQIEETNANVNLYFVPESEFPSIESKYIATNFGFFRVWWDSNGSIYKARILISSKGITQKQRSHLVREELTQILGLLNDSWRYPDSIFYQGWTSVNEYTALDRSVIPILDKARLERIGGGFKKWG